MTKNTPIGGHNKVPQVTNEEVLVYCLKEDIKSVQCHSKKAEDVFGATMLHTLFVCLDNYQQLLREIRTGESSNG